MPQAAMGMESASAGAKVRGEGKVRTQCFGGQKQYGGGKRGGKEEQAGN